MSSIIEISESVRHYYGQVLKSSSDLKTSACCSIDSVPTHLKPLIAALHPEVVERFYGCGSPLPPALEGCTVLDLGCGSGRDCYLLSKLVGEEGRVIGVDMTPEQLEVATRHRDWHADRFGYQNSNVEFLYGHIENLATLGIADNSIDVVVSNCVINLSPEKAQVMAEIFRVLKPGGELYFSDVFADRRIPANLRNDPVLLGECLGGALYWEDFRRILFDLGCLDVRTVKQNPITLDDPAVAAKIGMVKFRSVNVRAFKMPLEDRCEDYGQVACYKWRAISVPCRNIRTFLIWTTIIISKPDAPCASVATLLICWRKAVTLGISRYGATKPNTLVCLTVHPARRANR